MKKLVAVVLIGVMMFSLVSCKEDKTSKKKQEKPKATQTEKEDELSSYFDTFSGNGTSGDFNEITKNMDDIIKNNPIDNAMLKEIDELYDSKKWTTGAEQEIMSKYIDYWIAEWEASDKRILKTIKDKPMVEYAPDLDYDRIEKAYKNNKKITEEYIKKQSGLYATIWSENLSRENLYYNTIKTLNMYRNAALNSFQIEMCIPDGRAYKFVFKGE